jgi:hypothetical protein
MVSCSNTSLDAPHKTAIALALRASLPDSPRRRWPGAVARVMWNMRKRHFSHSCKTAAARMAVKGGRSLPVQRRLPRVSAPGRPFPPRSFAFNTLTPQQPKVTPAGTANRPFSPLVACFQHVYARKHVNASVCAPRRVHRIGAAHVNAQLPNGIPAATRWG